MAFKAFNKWGLQSFQQVRASKLSTSEGFKAFNKWGLLILYPKTSTQDNKQTNKQTKEST
jgi:hypothetical protein